jgi:hypothetical protein
MVTAMLCEWFALCARQADGYAVHPIIGAVPICQRCGDRMGVTVHPFDAEHPREDKP